MFFILNRMTGAFSKAYLNKKVILHAAQKAFLAYQLI
jgi:hypothetical protein